MGQPVPFLEHNSHNIRATYNGQFLAVDVNNDGWLDVIQTGFDDNQYNFTVFLNNKNFTFSSLSPVTISLSNPRTAWADIDNDGDMDFAVCGMENSGVKKTLIGLNNGDSTFTLKNYDIVGVTLGEPLWADFDNDGKADLLVYGIDNNSKRVTVLYKNNSNSFIEIKRLRGFSSGKAVIMDYNRDGKKDILITGIDQNIYKRIFLYNNLGNFSFSEETIDIDATTSGEMAVGDIDVNGWDDLVVTGLNQNGQRICKLYCNFSGSFIERYGAFIDSISSSTVSICDINNDGKPDIFFTGTDNNYFNKSIFYINAGNGNFFRDDSFTVPVTGALVLNADLNNDHKMDLIISGKTYSGNICKLFENATNKYNNSPPVPNGLSSIQYPVDSVLLQWNTVTDNEQGGTSMQYNIYIGSSILKDNVMAAQSIIPSGKRLIKQYGNALTSNSLKVHNLAEGKYYWAVQAMDNNYNASAFAPADSFVICNPVNAGNDTIICLGDTVTYQIPAGPRTCNWYSLHNGLVASNAFACKYSPLESDTLVLECMHTLGCVLYDTVNITVIPPLPIHLPTDTAGCVGTSIRLKINNGFKSASWQSAVNGFIHADSLVYWHKIAGLDTVQVTVIDTNNCRNQASVNIHKYDLPQWYAGNDRYVCKNDSVHLRINESFRSVQWYNIDRSYIKSSFPEYNTRITQNDSLLIVVTDSNNCSTSDTLIIFMLPLPTIEIGHDTSICFKDSILLRPATVNGKIDWYSKKTGLLASDTALLYYKVLANDSIVSLVTDTNNCHNTDTLLISVLPLPNFSIQHDTSLCYGQSTLLTVGTGWKKVQWFSGQEGILLDDSWYLERNWYGSDSIWAWVTNEYGCKYVDTAYVEVYPLPEVFAGNDTAICFKDTLRLIANEDFPSILWFSARKGTLGNTRQLEYPVLASDTLILRVNDLHQCANTDSVRVDVLSLPEISLRSDTSSCYGDTIIWSLNGQWKKINWTPLVQSNITSDSALFIYPVMVNDTIHVRVTDLAGCKSSSSITVKVNRLPFISLSDTAVCRFNCVNLGITDTLVQKTIWKLPDQTTFETNDKTFEYCPKISGKVIVTAISEKNCHKTDSLYVNIWELPEVSLGNDTAVCYGSRIRLGQGMIKSNTEVKTIAWKGVSFNQTHENMPEVELIKDTSFVVTVVDAHNCSTSDSLYISVNPPSMFNLPDTMVVCYGETVSINRPYIVSGSRYPYTFQWYPDSAISSIDNEFPQFNPVHTTTYRVIARTWECKPDTAYLTVLVRPLPVIYHTPDIAIGEKGFIKLYAEGGVKYQWYPANSLNQGDIPDPIASPDETTTYTVVVTDSFGCSRSDTLTVYVRNQVFVPDLFSPNNDGHNDEFRIYGIGILNLTLTITNMQNVVLYRSSNMEEITQKGWDGTFKGNPVPEGQYRWHLQGSFINGQQILYRGKNQGTFMLIR